MSNEVLIIEDEFLIGELVKINLKFKGITAITALNGQDGISAFKSENPSIVLLDVRLPDIDGWEVCKKLKENVPVPVVIFMTAATQAKDRIMARQVGGDEFVEKPFDINDLVFLVKKHLARCKS
jgi:DNA-binding response OmpR family regulator